MKAFTIASLFLSLSCTYAFDKGDTVVALRDTTAYFRDAPARQIKEGERVVVLQHNKDTGKVFFLSTDSSGSQIALNVDASTLVSNQYWASLGKGVEEKPAQQGIQGAWEVEFYKTDGGREISRFYVYDAANGKTYVYSDDAYMKKRINDFIALGVMKDNLISGRDRLKVTGAFWRDRWGREDRRRGFIASSIENADPPKATTLVDVLIRPADYLDKTVTMEGTFRYNNTEKKSFDMNQGDNKVEVFYEQYIPRDNWRPILTQKNFSEAKVSATGILRKFKDEDNIYYLEATSITISEPSTR